MASTTLLAPSKLEWKLVHPRPACLQSLRPSPHFARACWSTWPALKHNNMFLTCRTACQAGQDTWDTCRQEAMDYRQQQPQDRQPAWPRRCPRQVQHAAVGPCSMPYWQHKLRTCPPQATARSRHVPWTCVHTRHSVAPAGPMEHQYSCTPVALPWSQGEPHKLLIRHCVGMWSGFACVCFHCWV